MRPTIEAIFTDKIVVAAAKRYGLMPEALILLGKNQNFTYGSNNEARNLIIRIIHFLSHFKKVLVSHGVMKYLKMKSLINWEKLLGECHTLAKKYIQSTPEITRYDWQKNSYLQEFTTHIPSSQSRVIAHFESLSFS
ncbi:hypothetical protein [Paenibacillus sp. FSL R10-2734]|uniref:hypothetical protein n=1 Tax=Paenibacillus sp. FSL R10-2734 TaxID=2954691 RepID=UPI0030DA3573